MLSKSTLATSMDQCCGICLGKWQDKSLDLGILVSNLPGEFLAPATTMCLITWQALFHLWRRRYSANMSPSSRTWGKALAEKLGSCKELCPRTFSKILEETCKTLQLCSNSPPGKTMSTPSRTRILATPHLKKTNGGFHSLSNFWIRDVNSSPVRRAQLILMTS